VRACEDAGIRSELIALPADALESQLLAEMSG
jgi:hypothetical protein